MTRSLIIVFAVSLLASLNVFAADGSSGCGLGWRVTQRMSLVSSVVRGTTNYVLPNTFSMTSGTSGCAKHSIVLNEKAAIHFAESNYEALINDMALGKGEYLNNFASTLGCSNRTNRLSGVSKEMARTLLKNTTTTPSEMVKAFSNAINKDSTLFEVCSVPTA